MKPLLTIAVPTYNRCDYLRECLNAIYNEINDSNLGELVEVIVSDNASDDGTENMVLSEFPKVEYHKNLKNMGLDYNADKCFQYAHGTYTWVFSDDDIITKGGLKEVIKAIKLKPNFIHLNTIGFYQKFQGIDKCSEPRLKLRKNYVTKEKDKFFKKVNIFITFFTSSVFKTVLIQSMDRRRYNGSIIALAHTVLYCIKEEGKYIIVAAPCVAVRVGNAGGYNLFDVWVKNYKKLILHSGRDAGISSDVLKSVYRQTMMQFVRRFIIEFRTKEKGLGLKNRHYIFDGIKEFPELWLPMLFSTYAPVWLIRLLLKIKLFIRKIKNCYGKEEKR